MHVQITHSHLGEHTEDGVVVHEMSANIDGTDIPIAGYTIEQCENGPALNLVLLPDSLSIGEQPASTLAAPAVEQKPNLRTWGDPTIPDPRANMPGWPVAGPSARAELGEQIARQAECGA